MPVVAVADRTNDSDVTIDAFLRPVARARWLWALFAIACFVLGIVALAGDLDLAAFSTLLGVFLLVAGFFDAVGGLDENPSGRVFAVVLAVVAMIAGLVCLRRPDLVVVVAVAGVYLVVAGTLHLSSGFHAERPRAEWTLGGAYVVLGCLVLALPALRLDTLAPLVGGAILVRGVVALDAVVHARSTAPRWVQPTRG
jgi:uncharacterized membrane protein HdeD (DUF308 family)